MIIERTSELSGVTRTMEIDVCPQQIKEWEEGSLIQDVMPNLTPDEREFIMTGITSEEWDKSVSTQDVFWSTPNDEAIGI